MLGFQELLEARSGRRDLARVALAEALELSERADAPWEGLRSLLGEARALLELDAELGDGFPPASPR